jgi:transposase
METCVPGTDEMFRGKYGILNRYINDAALPLFFNLLSCKAQWAAGKPVKVNPRGATQRCSRCGEVVSKDLSVRVPDCPCGFRASGNHNAALNILRLRHSLCFKKPSALADGVVTF